METKSALEKNFIRVFLFSAIAGIILVLILLGWKGQAVINRRREDEKILRQVVSDISLSDKVKKEEIAVLVSVNPDIEDSSKKARCLQIEAGVRHALMEAGINVLNSTDKDLLAKENSNEASSVKITLYIDEDPEINSENVYAIYNDNFYSKIISNSRLADIMERYTAGSAGLVPVSIGAAGSNAPALSDCTNPGTLMLVSYPVDEDIKLSVNRLAKGMAQGLIVAINEIYEEES